MKIRYFLRGLGVGIIFSAVLMSLYVGNKKMSNEEIKKEAMKLGMVEKEPALEVLEKAEATATAKPTKKADATATPEATKEQTEKATTKPEATQSEKVEMVTQKTKAAVTQAPKVTQSVVEKTTTASTKVPKATKAVVTKKPEKQTSYVNVEISAGMWSDEIARKFQSMGIVDDADKFDDYLSENGYESNIKVGSYSVPKGASYDTVAKIITK